MPYHRNDSCERLNVPITISSLKYRGRPKYGLPGHDRETHRDIRNADERQAREPRLESRTERASDSRAIEYMMAGDK